MKNKSGEIREFDSVEVKGYFWRCKFAFSTFFKIFTKRKFIFIYFDEDVRDEMNRIQISLDSGEVSEEEIRETFETILDFYEETDSNNYLE